MAPWKNWLKNEKKKTWR